MRCLDAWRLCLTVEHESNAVLESGAGASLRRLLCLCAWRLCLTVERGSNGVFGCLATMPVRGAWKQCGVWVPGDYACPWSRKAMRCLSARRQCLTVEQGSNAVFGCLATMFDRGAGEQCAV